jgi:NAD(P)-dependent dehydrogenase (short-subunit alcohol dehydrogenase family)
VASGEYASESEVIREGLRALNVSERAFNDWLEVAPKAIRANSVHLGGIWTDLQKVANADTPEQYDASNASIRMRRMGDPEGIGQMIAFLSDKAKQVTGGGEFVVDGG